MSARFGLEILSMPAENWPHQLTELLAERGGSGSLDAVIDSGGCGIMVQVQKVLKPGGKVVVYGMYVAHFHACIS